MLYKVKGKMIKLCSNPDRFKHVIVEILPKDERKVIQLLIERNEIEQKRLATLTELNTVKISRVISTLEQRGIIEKKKQGYTNLIILKLW